jgi:hypothetical protein
MFTGISRDKNNGRHDPHNFRPLCDNAAMSTNHASHLISDSNLNPNRNPNLSPSPEFAPNFKLVIRILAFDISAHPNLCLSVLIRGLNSCRQGCPPHCQPNRGNNLKMPKMPKSVQLSPEPAAWGTLTFYSTRQKLPAGRFYLCVCPGHSDLGIRHSLAEFQCCPFPALTLYKMAPAGVYPVE